MENLRILKLSSNISASDIEKLSHYPLKNTLEELSIVESDLNSLGMLLQFDSLQYLYLSGSTYDNNTETINELKAKGCDIYRDGQLTE